MNDEAKAGLPELLVQLTQLGCLGTAAIYNTCDGFWAATTTLADILASKGITELPDSRGEGMECKLFFDDWHLYAVPDGSGWVYGLFKMREQEYDAELGRKADGDTPGVTISFIALQSHVLLECLEDPTEQNRGRLGAEINRVVAHRGQKHSRALKRYFVRTEAQGAYLVAALYIRYIAAMAREGVLPVPKVYGAEYRKKGLRSRVARFIEENNRAAGRVVCDHEKICMCDPHDLTEPEGMAILATHTANTSLYSFAAEVQFHAKYLTWWSRIPIPFVGKSPYESAIRADMSIGDAEFAGPTPYYRVTSRIVREQYACHEAAVTAFLQECG